MPDPQPSAEFTVNGSAVDGEIEVAAGSTVTLALASVYGAGVISWSFLGSHDPDVVNPTITAAGYPSGVTASFVMPATAGDQGFLVQCRINGGRDLTGSLNSAYTATALVGVNATGNGVPFVFGETFERGSYGYVPKLNETIAGAAAQNAATIAIAGGAIASTYSSGGRITAQAESGTADDLQEISGVAAGYIVTLKPDVGDTITVLDFNDPGGGNIKLNGQVNAVLAFTDDRLELISDGTYLYEIGRMQKSASFVGTNRTADGGNPRVALAPNAVAHVNAQANSSTVNYDITLSENGYYMFTVVAFVQMATALSYHRVGALIDASRASGTLTAEGVQVPLSGGDGTGLTLTLSATSGNLRCALANATGETINGHINVGWILTDLPS